jgi:hypothetical protein
VLKIVCGAGKHSLSGEGVLIKQIPEYIERIWNYPREDMYLIDYDGILLLKMNC